MLLSPGTRLGPYEVIAAIGAGGMGEVYRARDTRLARDVAVKILPEAVASDPAAVARFSREARAVAALSHPNIVVIHDVGTEGDTAFVVMELLEGGTLRQEIGRDALPLRRTLDYALQLAQGLAAAHARGIVHRDLKPENVIVTTDGQLKILDFGLAKPVAPAAGPEGDGTTIVQSGAGLVLGTVGYLSPEQAAGAAVDQRSDVFSFGCVLYEMASGDRAFGGDTAVDVMHAVLHRDPPALAVRAPDSPPELQRIVARCLAKDPEERYQSTRDLVVELRALARQVDSGAVPWATAPVPVPPPTSAPAAARAVRPGRWLLPAGVAVLGVVVAATALWLWRRPTAEDRTGHPPAPPSIERLTSSGKVTSSAISPDGKYLAYVVSDAPLQSLWVRQLDGASSLQLVPPATVGYWGVTFSPDESAIYYVVKSRFDSGGALYRVPVLGGAPRKLLSGLDSIVTFSPDGTRMAYVRADHPALGESAVMVARADGSDARVLAARKPPEYFAPIFYAQASWSPDGATIAVPVETRRDRQRGRLVLLGSSDGVERSFPGEDWSSIAGTAWLPDGSGVLVTASLTGSTQQVWLLDARTGSRRSLTNDLFGYRTPSVSRDATTVAAVAAEVLSSVWVGPVAGPGEMARISTGRSDGMSGLSWASNDHLLYRSLESGRPDVWLMRDDGSERRQVTTDGGSSWPRAMPDGRSVLVSSSRGQPLSVWRSDLDGQNPVRLDGTEFAEDMVPSPDGTWMAFVTTAGGVRSIWTKPLNGGGAARQLVNAYSARPAISPDGKAIACYYRGTPDGPLVLAVIPVGAAGPTKTFEVAASLAFSMVRWAPDGRALLHNAALKDRANIWLQPLDGSAPRPVTRFVDQDVLGFDLSPDGKRLAVARGVLSRDAVQIRNFR